MYMNLAFTKVKTTISLVVSTLIGLVLVLTNKCYDCPGSVVLKSGLEVFIGFGLISFVVIYGIWSSFQFKNEKKVWVIIGGVVSSLVLAFILFFLLVFLMKSL